jgi:YggT family protein
MAAFTSAGRPLSSETRGGGGGFLHHRCRPRKGGRRAVAGSRPLGWQPPRGKASLAPAAGNGYMSRNRSETGMVALIETILLALNIYWTLLIAAVIFSWLFAFNVINGRNQFVATIGDFLYRVTEPALRPIRRVMPDLGGIDISPLLLILILYFLSVFIDTTVRDWLL